MELKIEGQVLGEGGEDGGLVRITGRDGTIDEVSIDEDHSQCAVVVCEPGSGKVSDVFLISCDLECTWSIVHKVASGRLETVINEPAGTAAVSGPMGLVHALGYWPPKAEELAHYLEDLVEVMSVEDLFEVYQLALSRVRVAAADKSAASSSSVDVQPPPSRIELCLDGAAPFISCFGRFEREVCAAAYVEACRVRGDRWQVLGAAEVMGALVSWIESDKPPTWASFSAAMHRLPDVHGLISAGFFEKVSEGDEFRIQPTPLFFQALASKGYVRAVAA